MASESVIVVLGLLTSVPGRPDSFLSVEAS